MSRDRLQYVPLSDLAEINPRKDVGLSGESTPVSFIPMGDVSESGTWVNRQTRPLGEVDSGYTSFKEGDVLFAKITPCMENGKGCHARNLVNGHGFGSTEFHVLRAIDGVSDARFLYHWTRTPMLRLKAESAMSGSAGQQRVSTWFFDEFKVPRIPLPEQRRIADVLDTVDAAIQETDAVVEKQEQVKTGLLQDLLTRGLDADGRLRDPERKPEAFRETELGLLPIGWRVVDLEAVTKRITDGSHQAVDTLPDASDGIPFLYVSCIRNGEIYWDQASSITRETFESISKSKEPKPGVILYTTVGSYGHAALVKDEVNFSFQRHVGYIDPDTDKVRPQFLAYWLDSEYCKRHADKIALGSSQKTVTLRDLARYPVPLPSYEEQKKIAERLDEIDSSIKGDRAYKNKLQNLKTGLMQDLLTGRVRVPEAEDRVDEVVA
jgi:type I restriction enzyme S subunit